MPTLGQLAAEMTGSMPGLSNLYARKFINQALEEIQTDYLWSWMIGEGILIIPTAVAAGTATVTYLSNQVQFDATAMAAIAAFGTNPPVTQCQFRVPSSGPVYNITAYNAGTGIATLDRLYTEPSGVGQEYTIYQIYFNPPSIDGTTPNTDFLRYLSILNPINGYSITGKRLYMNRSELNRRDPLRGAIGLPYYAANYKPNSLGQMMIELWPQCTSQLGLLCNYQKKHTDLLPNDSLPNQAPSILLRYGAWTYAYRWALQNVGRIPELKGTDWRFALSEAQSTYAKELVTAKKNDKEILLKLWRPGSGYTYDFQGPIDSNFAQSHGIAGY